MSSLYWMNLAFGALLTLATIAAAPAISAFYQEPALVGVTRAIAFSFLITGAGLQHGVLLHRRMMFGVAATIEFIGLLISVATSIAIAAAGGGYWALVSATLTLPLANTVGLWIATRWVPGRPRMGPALMSMLRFGAGSTLTGFATYFASNIDKLLLGRVWGSEALGLYVRAFTLISFPTDSLNATIGEVAFAALSRTRGDPERLRRYFLKSYSLVVMFTLPLATVFGLFANDFVDVVLGPKWHASAEIFRVLAPTVLVLAILNPLGWLLTALGLVTRGLHIASTTAPLVAIVVIIALPYGPLGVATAYSSAMVLRVIPVAAWALRGTGVRLGEIVAGLSRPLAASAAAAVFALSMRSVYGSVQLSQLRLLLELSLFFGLYAPTIFLIAGRGGMFQDLLRTARATPQ